MDVRLIIDEPASGTWNMAVDEALLRSTCEAGALTVRFYHWREPTLSLGYFQSRADRLSDPRLSTLPLVRRSTGGGAILHDRELTYSLVVPIRDRFGNGARQFVVALHEELVAVLKDYGVSASLCASADPQECSRAFLCFERRETLDVLLGGYKVAGSAQRRHRGALLQHGSILLQSSSVLPELLGIGDLALHAMDARELTRAWLARLTNRLGWRFETAPYTAEEIDWAKEYEQEQYAAEEWNGRR